MYPRPIVALVGKKRAGKDTFAARLVDTHGFTRVAFADCLKMAVLIANPIIDGTAHNHMRIADLVKVVGWEGAKEDDEVRRTLQEFGQAIRQIDPNFWINAALRLIERTPGPIVVTDVRYPNELDRLYEMHAVGVRIVRPSLADDDPHISETALDDAYVPITVTNDSTVLDLWVEADNVANFARMECDTRSL